MSTNMYWDALLHTETSMMTIHQYIIVDISYLITPYKIPPPSLYNKIFAMGFLTRWSLWGNPGMARCQEMSTLPAGYISQRKVTSASSSGSLGFIVCVKFCMIVYRLTQRNCSERRAPPWVDRVCNRTSVTGFLPFEPFKFDIFWNLHQPKGVPSSHFHQPKSLGWWKVRGGQIKKNAKFRWFKWPKTCYTLSITYSINPRGCPPLTAISLGQAVPRWQQSLSWSMQSSVNRRSDDTAFGAGTFSWQDPVH